MPGLRKTRSLHPVNGMMQSYLQRTEAPFVAAGIVSTGRCWAAQWCFFFHLLRCGGICIFTYHNTALT